MILSDTDHLWGAPGDRVWVWKTFLRGLNPINYMELTQLPDLSSRLELARRAMGDTPRWAERMNLATMTPRNELSSTRFCLANPGQQYLVYLPDGGEATVDLTAAAGTFALEWMHPVDGTITPGEVALGGDKRALKAPFAGDAVLHIRKQ